MLSVIVAGVTYSLDDGTLCYFIDHDGLGMTPLHRIKQRGPLQHGQTDLDFRLDPRTIRLVLEMDASDSPNYWNRRKQIISLFKPRLTPPILEFALDNGDTRRIDVHYAGDMTLPDADRSSLSQRVVLTLVADEPTFYDPTGEAITFTYGGGGGLMVIPKTIPFTLGASAIDETRTVTYSGQWASYPDLIRITGPITSPVLTVTHGSTSEKLDFTGTTIAAGDHYDIDCRYGYKTIVDSAGTNQMSKLTADSRLDTWRLEADPDAPGGINTVHLVGTNISGATKLEINFKNYYLGE